MSTKDTYRVVTRGPDGQLRIHDYIEHIIIAIDRINQYTSGMELGVD